MSDLDKRNQIESPVFLLIGIGGVYNYGCEAIILGTELILKKEFPDSEIIYASMRKADDEKRLQGTTIRIVERQMIGRFSFKKIFGKLLSAIGVNWFPLIDSLKLLKNVDAVLSIGGDIYTLRPDNSYSMSFPKFGDAAQKAGIPFILWGASVGPFTVNLKAEKVYTKHLKSLSLITTRESATLNYLKSLEIKSNVDRCADPGFIVAPEIVKSGFRQPNKLIIGINLSPLSARYKNQPSQEATYLQAKAIQELIEKCKARIVLLPHVVCDFKEQDDDFRYLKKIQDQIGSEFRKDVTILPPNIGFVKTKRELIKCDMVIAARMHCAINAITAHVPTLFIAYSRKAEGMCHYVYGNQEYILQLNDFEREGILLEKVLFMEKNLSAIYKYFKTRLPEIQNDVFIPTIRLREILERKKCLRSK